MQQVQWQLFITQFASLSRRQRLESMALLRGTPPVQAATALIERTTQARLYCPACHSLHFHRHGQANGLQR